MAKKSIAKATDARPVIVCTDKRGVFFGYSDNVDGDTIILTNARMCVYWDQMIHGVVGLSATGPNAHCRISPAGPRIQLRGITCVMDCTPEAVAEWEKSPWG